MRFSLQDVKKSVQRRQGELFVSLHFLRPKELVSEITTLITYYERMTGQPQHAFSPDEARACTGDYRLANCLMATLGAWYSWQSPDWSKTLEQYGNQPYDLLNAENIVSPVHLRLALFTFVNEHYSGFLDTHTRSPALQTFARLYQLNASQLEYLLALDSDDSALLTRADEQPRPQEVATLYNQWVFEAALFNASRVQFLIDCSGFEDAHHGETGVGAIIKRLCYLARVMGVYYDLSYADADITNTTTSTLLQLTLYGPQEMTGAPQQYGMRLTRLCRTLLGYRHTTGITLPPDAIREATATVHFLQRSYMFAIDSRVLSLLPTVTENNSDDSIVPASPTTIYDSSIEQSFAEAFTALEASNAVDGWSLIREPEPLLLEQSIFIPDFALTRGGRRIYVEILGFWTPSYRERKVQKLQQLRERTDLVLAIPVEAREAFASITTAFPVVWYKGQLSATELLQVLRRHYDDLDERLAQIDEAQVQAEVERIGLIPERSCYKLLHCYRRSELVRAAEQIVNEHITFVAGIGLYSVNWLEHLRASFVEWIGSAGSMSLAEVLRESRERWPELASCEDATIEALIGLWSEVHINRSSIFEATVALMTQVTPSHTEYEAIQPVPAKKIVREKRPPAKKHPTPETQQDDLWG